MNKKIPAPEFQTSTSPAAWKVKAYRVFYFFFGGIGRLILSRNFDSIETIGEEHLRGGAKLLLMNHSCPLDPVLITFFGRQPLQFLVTEAFMQGSFASKLGSAFGQISKRKLDFDTSSIRLMKQWCDSGGVVATFPEGQFSWDGKPGALMPGIEQLIQYLKVPVVIVNLENGNRVKPAWATFSRKTSIKITINPPIVFKKEDKCAETIVNQLFKGRAQFDSRGENLVSGLKKHLRFCPSCSKDKTITENLDILFCKSCDNSWEVNANNEVLGPKIKSSSEFIDNLYQQLDVFWSDEKAYTSVGEAELIDITKSKWIFKTRGKFHMDEKKIRISQTEILCSDIQSHTLDWGDIIIIKTRFDRYAVKLPHDSRIIISYLLDKVLL